ncbi:MAG: hypothetical protein GKR97_12695 [Rhizobiaceae bacterium]|nr:hypothetical protein [Rhizobiaceae bacterium]
MKEALETQRSFVNSWECDENAHMNIQFYWKRFGDAGQIFFHLNKSHLQNWVDRHVRYHGELMMGTNTIVRSARISNENKVVHHLINGDSGELSATAVDVYPAATEGVAPALNQIPSNSEPRSLPQNQLPPSDTQEKINNGSGLVSHRCVVAPHECDAQGVVLDQHQIARFSDAASHLWQHLGVSRQWMRQLDLGTVAVEMKASRHNEARVGTMLEVVTWVESIQAKTMTFRHQVGDLATGLPLYSGAVTALLMDLKTRKAIELPDMMRRPTIG